ncbi:MAG: ATP-binding protein [Faecalibacterium sp.]
MDELMVPARTEALEDVQAFLEERLEHCACSPGLQTQLCLVAEEIFVNIAHHAYPDGEGSAAIGVQISGQPPVLTMRFADRGIPFDPLARPQADITLSAQERPIGGLGIFLARKIMDEAAYSYEEGQNILTLRKKL